jgi:hypothetical protein
MLLPEFHLAIFTKYNKLGVFMVFLALSLQFRFSIAMIDFIYQLASITKIDAIWNYIIFEVEIFLCEIVLVVIFNDLAICFVWSKYLFCFVCILRLFAGILKQSNQHIVLYSMRNHQFLNKFLTQSISMKGLLVL